MRLEQLERGETGVGRGQERGERHIGHAVPTLPGLRLEKLKRGETGVQKGLRKGLETPWACSTGSPCHEVGVVRDRLETHQACNTGSPWHEFRNVKEVREG